MGTGHPGFDLGGDLVGAPIRPGAPVGRGSQAVPMCHASGGTTHPFGAPGRNRTPDTHGFGQCGHIL
jgi:hypothetical protein